MIARECDHAMLRDRRGASCLYVSLTTSMAGHRLLDCVQLTPPSSRLLEDTGKNNDFYVVFVGPKFQYVISGFEVLLVDLRIIQIHAYDKEGELVVCDLFVRDDPSLDNRVYPAGMEVHDQTCLMVSQIVVHLCLTVALSLMHAW